MRTTLCAGIFLALVHSFPAFADQAVSPVLRSNFNSIWFENWVGLSNAMLRVAAPDGSVETIYEERRTPRYRLSGARIVDGQYRFELRAATDKTVALSEDLPWTADAKDRPSTAPVPFYMSGAFQVRNGAVVQIADEP